MPQLPPVGLTTGAVQTRPGNQIAVYQSRDRAGRRASALDSWTKCNQNGGRKEPPAVPSLTLKNIPGPLLERLRERAGADRRSLTQEILYLLEGALARLPRERGAEAEARAQVDAWSRLAGGWRSDLDPHEEAERILAARTHGRDVEL